MIQKIQDRRIDGISIRKASHADHMHWGQWVNDKYYSLEVSQHPIRARMCGFGDKDRRPLAPAAVAKMVVRDKNDIIIPPDDTDISFFVVTVDLWSEDGQQEMNLVLNPNSSDRYVPATQPRIHKPKAPPPTSTNASRNPIPSPITPSQAFGGQHAFYSADNPDNDGSGSGIALTLPYPNQRIVQPPSAYPHGRGSLPPIASLKNSPHPTPPIEGSTPYRAWEAGGNMYTTSHNPGTEGYSQISLVSPNFYPAGTPGRHDPNNPQPSTAPVTVSQSNIVPKTTNTPYYRAPPSPPPVTLPRHTYTRTLVGPLCANACRLKDEHRQLGIFFLFQDLSVRTEGVFRLRMRLMNVGAPPAPEWGATVVTTGSVPILAQTYTEPFTVYSAKRFPGVPDTTALSIAFGNQGQKLPLRNRHAQRPVRGKRKRGSDDEGDSGED